MNVKAEFMDRYFFWRGKGYSHMDAKKQAIAEMMAFNLIKDEKDLIVIKEG